MTNKATTGLQVAVTILKKWGATTEQGTAILRVSPDTYAHAKQRDPEWKIRLDDDQLARISYVLNIHAALRVLFDNPDNLYGFMGMANHNEGFNGRSPLEVIACGSLTSLHETWQRLDALSHTACLLVEPAKPKYSLQELLAKCDTTADMSADERRWLDSGPVGRELL